MDDLGSAKDIEYIRKGVSELSVIIWFSYLLLFSWPSDNFNRRGIEHLDRPQILPRPCNALFYGQMCVFFLSPLRNLLPWQLFFIRRWKLNLGMVLFRIVLSNWRTRASRVQLSNWLINGLVLFSTQNVTDSYMRMKIHPRMMQIPVQVVHILYEVSGRNSFWMWKHGFRMHWTLLSGTPAS